MSSHIRMDCKPCIKPSFTNSISVGTENQRKHTCASNISHQLDQIGTTVLVGCPYSICKNILAVQVSGLSCFVSYEVFAVRLWNCTIFICLSFLQSFLTAKRLLGLALDFVLPPFGCALLKSARISLA